MYISSRFDEALTIRKPKIMMFSITGSQIFLADFVIYIPEAIEKPLTGLPFTPLPDLIQYITVSTPREIIICLGQGGIFWQCVYVYKITQKAVDGF